MKAVAVGEGQRIAVDDPQDGDHAEADEHLHEHGKHVLGAHQAAVEKCEARNGHENHQAVATSIQAVSPLLTVAAA